jgi:membrane-bound serine protease (ClpP class)
MLPGSSIGAATVVNENAEALPDKYQSYMRSMMRSTAETRGRNPRIAEAMVDGRVVVEGLNDSGRVVTLTASEAVQWKISDGTVKSQAEILQLENLSDATIINYEVSWIDNFISWLMHPAVSGVLILLMLGGLYYELQHPGIGLPLLIAITAAVLYFAPMYLEGLAANWEILVVLIGIGLLLAEIFVIPGFGIAGIAGIALLVFGLLVSMLPNDGFDFGLVTPISIYSSVAVIVLSMSGVLLLFLATSKMMASSPFVKRFTLVGQMNASEGYSTAVYSETTIGTTGTAVSDLRPSGKIEIGGVVYTASAETGYIVAGTSVVVTGNRPNIVVKEV